MSLRIRFLSRLEAAVGLNGKAGPAREAYALHLGGPNEDHAVAVAMASYRAIDPKTGKEVFSSTCGLEMRCDLRDAGFVDPKRISGGYRPRMGLVMSDLEAIAVEHDAKVDPALGALPKGGDIAALAWTDPAHAHVFGIESVELVDERTLRIVAVEGGQIDREQPPNQVTARKIHTWKWHPERGVRGQWLDTSIAIEPVGVVVDGVTARPVSWWIDLDKLDVSAAPRGDARTDPAPPPAMSLFPTGNEAAEPLPSVTLRKGSTGPVVKRWQTIIGVIPPRVDGIFGSGTEELTKVWQTRHGLTPDGVVGARTWAAAIGTTVSTSGVSIARPVAPPVAPLEGIDVSHYQASARFDEVAKAGIGFCFVKLGQGSHLRPRYEDSSAKKLCAGVRDAGLLLGGYHYEMARPEDARVQAEDFFEAWQRERCELAELDIEWMNNEKASPEQFRDASAILLERWDELSGRHPVFVYGSQSELDAALIHQIPGIGARPLSAAHYTAGPKPLLAKAWKDYVLWQYTGSGRVPGIDGDCDRYRFRGSLEELQAFGRAR